MVHAGIRLLLLFHLREPLLVILDPCADIIHLLNIPYLLVTHLVLAQICVREYLRCKVKIEV